MTEVSHTSQAADRAGTRRRNLIILSSVVPIAALFALLGWAVAQSGGTPGGFGVNNKFGEISVDQRPAADFATESPDGETVSLAGLGGKVVMLDFWSSWCPPCRREAPALAQVYREYEGRNIEFVGIAIWDDPQDVARYVERFELPYPNVLDEKGRIAINYGVSGIPEKFFINPQGELVRKFVGPISPQALRAALDSLLAPEITDPPARHSPGPKEAVNE